MWHVKEQKEKIIIYECCGLERFQLNLGGHEEFYETT